MVIVIMELHSSWKKAVVTEVQWVAIECDRIYGELHMLQLMHLCSITFMGVEI
jgi:hypothetical protein